MLMHWFIGFYACFVALVFCFISGSNHQHRAQTRSFGRIHCSPKHRGLKEVKRHEPSHKNKPKRSQNRSTWPKWARATLLKSEAEYYISEVRSTGRESWLGSSKVHSNFQSFWSSAGFNSGVQYIRSTGRAELNFTFYPIFEVSNVGPDGG